MSLWSLHGHQLMGRQALEPTPNGPVLADVWFLWPPLFPGACSFLIPFFPRLKFEHPADKLCEIHYQGKTKRLRLWSSLPKCVHTHPRPQNPHPTLLEFSLCLEILWLPETMLVLLVVKENQL